MEVGRLTIPLPTLAYKTNTDAEKAAKLVEAALVKAIDVVAPLR
jgi:hypothetical protein